MFVQVILWWDKKITLFTLKWCSQEWSQLLVDHHNYRHDGSKLNGGLFLCLPCFEQPVGSNKSEYPKFTNTTGMTSESSADLHERAMMLSYFTWAF